MVSLDEDIATQVQIEDAATEEDDDDEEELSDEAIEWMLLTMLPVTCLLGLKLFCFSSLFRLYVFLQTMHTWCSVNLVHEVAKEGTDDPPNRLRLAFIFIVVTLSSTYYMPLRHWKCLTDLTPIFYLCTPVQLLDNYDDFWTVALSTSNACLLSKQVILTVKTLIALLPANQMNSVRKKKVYKFVELMSHLYCECLSIRPWWNYFRFGDEAPTLKNISLVIAWLYFYYKEAKIITIRLPKLLESWNELTQSGPLYGKPTPLERLNANQTCPVCFGELQIPVTVECQHIFCNACISRWIEAENKSECPVCRKTVFHGDVDWLGAESKVLIMAF